LGAHEVIFCYFNFVTIFFRLTMFSFPQSTSGVVFAIMGLMSRLTSGALIITIQKLFPQGR